MVKIVKKVWNKIFYRKNLLNQMSCKIDYLAEENKLLCEEIYKLKKQSIKIISDMNNSSSYLQLMNINKYSNKNKVLIVGFYGAPNLGDELMLETILDHLKDDDKVEITIMLCENYDYDITKYPCANIIHYPRNFADINYLAQYFDTILFGGGALIDDYDYESESDQLSLGYTLINLSMRAIKYKKKTILYGLSTSKTITNEEFIEKLKYISKNCTYFSLRDTNSLKVLNQCGIDTENIKIVNDIVLSNKDLLISDNKADNIITAIYVCNEKTYQLCIELTKILLNNYKNSRIVFMPYYSYKNNDLLFYKKIINEIQDDRLSINNPPYSMKELNSILSKSKLIVSMRYHISLIANFNNIKTISLLYSINNQYQNKMNYIYDNYKFKKNMCDYTKLDDFKKIIESYQKDKIDNKKITKVIEQSNNEINNMINLINS